MMRKQRALADRMPELQRKNMNLGRKPLGLGPGWGLIIRSLEFHSAETRKRKLLWAIVTPE